MLPPNISGNVVILSPEVISAAGRSADKLSLQNLQSKMKCDPESYTAELDLIYRQFKSSLDLFQQQAALSFNSLSGVAADPFVSKHLAEGSFFLAHMFPHYPDRLVDFPKPLADLLRSSAHSLPSSLRSHLTRGLILLVNRKREEESIAKSALVTLCDLHRRKVWSDDRTVNAICMACFHPSSRIMIAALSSHLDVHCS